MDFISLTKIAISNLRSNIVRTGLTVLGIVIGIASVIVVFSAGEGIRGLILDQIESFGTDIIETEIKVPTGKRGLAAEQQSAMGLATGVQITTLTLEDMEDIKDLPNVRDGYAAIMSQEQVGYSNEIKKAFLLGATASYIDIDKSELESGRFFTEAEDKSLAKVVVLGSKIKDTLFGDLDPIGKSIKIKKDKFRVIGIMEERGAVMTIDFDDYVYVPIRTLQKRMMGIDHVLYMVHRLYDLSISEQTAAEARTILRENHDIAKPEILPSGEEDTSKDDFRVVTMDEMMETLDVVTNALTILLLAIVVISLIVGGVGIMNIMYVVVSERTSEIGLRKAVGAKFNAIMIQFLIESVLVTLIGGIVGILLGLLMSYLICIGANSAGLEWDFGVPFRAYVVAISFSVLFGVVFGLFPARKAAKLDPIEALRNE